ncbi:hypothetical protein E2C01_067011 [Portunus trituberculatus]|uniref:Uncharacterized protein n=1 Tax=Portunus trituberculatus TaxID=210409 RepID=A0A5B7HVG1_PORTR|nr:hypothetical protein [Portunus trituberculatus]
MLPHRDSTSLKRRPDSAPDTRLDASFMLGGCRARRRWMTCLEIAALQGGAWRGVTVHFCC